MSSVDNLMGSGARPLATSRNILLDTCFYDVKSLSPAEMKEFSVTPDQEGAVIVVSPGNANRKIRHYASGTEMLKEEGCSIGGVAISGVGSSVVGTAAHPKNLKILVGHSKGAILINYVLDQFVHRMEGNDHPYYDDLHVVTIGVVIGIAKEFTKSSQLIGKLDWFGGINSLPSLLWETDPNVRPRFIENAWHHLNREIPFDLRLSDALAKHVALD